jgi:prevent-host-death family protein
MQASRTTPMPSRETKEHPVSQPDRATYTLDVDLERGVVPISKAASSLAALIKRARVNRQPIVITQKGYPTGVLLDIELFTALRQLADRQLRTDAGAAEEA